MSYTYFLLSRVCFLFCSCLFRRHSNKRTSIVNTYREREKERQKITNHLLISSARDRFCCWFRNLLSHKICCMRIANILEKAHLFSMSFLNILIITDHWIFFHYILEKKMRKRTTLFLSRKIAWLILLDSMFYR